MTHGGLGHQEGPVCGGRCPEGHRRKAVSILRAQHIVPVYIYMSKRLIATNSHDLGTIFPWYKCVLLILAFAHARTHAHTHTAIVNRSII